jgi:hypothetical protein
MYQYLNKSRKIPYNRESSLSAGNDQSFQIRKMEKGNAKQMFHTLNPFDVSGIQTEM